MTSVLLGRLVFAVVATAMIAKAINSVSDGFFAKTFFHCRTSAPRGEAEEAEKCVSQQAA